jgi:hypothetical protein
VTLQNGSAGPGRAGRLRSSTVSTTAAEGVAQSNEAMRRCAIWSCALRARLQALRAVSRPTTVPVLLSGVTVNSCALEGVSVDGAVDLTLEGCVLVTPTATRAAT